MGLINTGERVLLSESIHALLFFIELMLHSAIRSDERDFIRSRLLQSGISAEISRLTSINAIVIGKIARIDFPEQW